MGNGFMFSQHEVQKRERNHNSRLLSCCYKEHLILMTVSSHWFDPEYVIVLVFLQASAWTKAENSWKVSTH